MFYALAFVAGFVGSIYAWPSIRTFALGVEEEALRLRDRARSLEAKIKGN